MFYLNLSAQPEWTGLGHGVDVLLAPLTTAMFNAARADPQLAEVAEDAAPNARALALAKALAHRAVLDWNGVGDADGNPILPSLEAISSLLDLYPFFEAFNGKYVAKGLLLSAEGNGSAPSPNGTSAVAMDTARPAPADALPAPNA